MLGKSTRTLSWDTSRSGIFTLTCVNSLEWYSYSRARDVHSCERTTSFRSFRWPTAMQQNRIPKMHCPAEVTNLMNDTTASRHPLNVSRLDDPAIACAVMMLHFPLKGNGDCLKSTVRMLKNGERNNENNNMWGKADMDNLKRCLTWIFFLHNQSLLQ